MPDRHLRGLVIQRLERETRPEDAWSAFVLGALEGAEELRALLESSQAEGDHGAGEDGKDGEAAGPTPAGPAFLQSVTVEGFRGIGPGSSLQVAAGPGLTLVVGRNGCGKSSFAEALELLLTGDTYRWKAKKSVIWREGWRNLHHDRADIRTELLLQGESGVCTVAREWNGSENLEDARTWAQVHGKPRTDPSALGWEHALSSYRPFLSYNELGSLLDDGPSKLYDALAAILGLEDLVQAQSVLEKERKRRDAALKEARKQREEIAEQLAGLDDPRAEQVVAALAEDSWGLDGIDEVLTGGGSAEDGENTLRILRRLSTLPAPDEEAVAEAVADLRAKAKAMSTASDSLAARSADLAALLDHALGFQGTHGGDDCPVCGTAGAVGGGWAAEKAAEADRLRQEAIEVRDSRKALRAAMEAVGEFTVPDGGFLETAVGLGLDEELAALREAVAAWEAAGEAEEPEARAAGVERAAAGIRAAVAPVQERAAEELGRREDAWRPVATVLARWVPGAREALAEGVWAKDLRRAEDWLKTAGEDIRTERFAPIADQAIAIWEQLRVQSNVTLGAVRLGGRGKRRRVELDVTVDGQGGTALGVMSQGELHSLALSLFIPRATLEESPFRFVVIDDPVQSMDPARVDGLARVLEAAAKERQVIVFTHDDRLPEAVRRLEIDARVIEVTRREGSVVEVRDAKDPVSRYIEDAMALAYTDGLPEEAARRVVPGLCRGAVEAACMEAVRRRRLGKGEAHAEVEAELLKAQRLTNLAALALFDDAGRAGEVMTRINKDRGRPAGDAFKACNEGAHGNFGGVLVEFVREAEKLAQWLQGL